MVRWSDIPIFQNFPLFIVIHTVKGLAIVIHTVKGFGTVNKTKLDIFLELSRFFDDPADVGNLISGSSAFSKTSLNNWKFMVHVLLKPGLESFEQYFASMCDLPVVSNSIVTPWTVPHQAPPSLGFFRQEYWSGSPFPSPGDLPDQGSSLGLLHCRQVCHRLSHQGSSHLVCVCCCHCC